MACKFCYPPIVEPPTVPQEKPGKLGHPFWAKINVLNYNVYISASLVPLQHLRASSNACQSFLDDTPGKGVEIDLQYVKTEAVLRYISCISPALADALPEFDFDIGNEKGATAPVAIVSRIEWTVADTVDLYQVASLLDDRNVCNLVIIHWLDQLKLDEIVVDTEAICSLFDNPYTLDGARELWADICACVWTMNDIDPDELSLPTNDGGTKLAEMVHQKLANILQPHEIIKKYADAFLPPLKSNNTAKINFSAVASRVIYGAHSRVPKTVDEWLGIDTEHPPKHVGMKNFKPWKEIDARIPQITELFISEHQRLLEQEG